jgi:hypothetical protein
MRTTVRKPQLTREPGVGTGNNPAAPQVQPVVPFCQGSKPETEIAQAFPLLQLGAASQILGPVALPANGYVRAVWLEVETTTVGVIGAGVASADYPFNMFEQIKLAEPNGAPLGMELKGYNAYLANVLGAYAGSPDPKQQFLFSPTAISPRFALRVPVELAPNGLGALGNQSASAALRLTLTLSPSTVAYTTPLTTNPIFTVRVIMELWGEPPERDILGRAVAQAPPFEGTAQYWSEQAGVPIAAGQNNTRITRVGSMIRTLVFVFRAAGVRSDTPAPLFPQLQWDNRVFRTHSQFYNWNSMEEFVEKISERPTGVLWFQFSQGEHRHAGENEINSWLATLTSTRLELLGNSGGAGTVDILVNDVSVTAINPLERTRQIGVGGYHPPVGETNTVAA